jgi:hypothetical protein
MWLINFILKLFKREKPPEVKEPSIGAFTMTPKKPMNNNQLGTWTGPYRRR